MNQLDVYYRALAAYRQNTVADKSCSALRAAIAATDADKDEIVVTRAICSIDNDWVDAIEQGLVYIENAINEERQFIRSNGEVVPIEKVKHVSRESVEHLAKHSNLISRYEEDEDIIPDNLYTVERLNDYAVYENRFLYMLLCYVRDFVTIRYTDILNLTNKYDATVEIDKKVSKGKQKLSYKLSMSDVRQDDPYLIENNPAKDTIDRIGCILETVLMFLGTPLMEEVSKVAMLKPPITKTNVLKMNKNFKGAMALYDFIIMYDKRGYTVDTKKTVLSPFKEDLADEIAEAACLVSFLAYEYGFGLKPELQDSYEIDQARIKAENIKQGEEYLAQLKKKVKGSQMSLEEYALALEAQLRELSGESDRIEALAAKLNSEREKNKRLNGKVMLLNNDIEKLNLRLTDIENEHQEQLEFISQQHSEQIRELVENHATEILQIREEEKQTEERHASELAKVRKETREQIDNIRAESKAIVIKAKKECDESNARLADFKSAYTVLLEEKRVAEARVKALYGVSEDLTDRDSFNELEKEYNAFTKVYQEQWKKTRKQIKKNTLNFKNLRGTKEKKGKENTDVSEPD